MEKVFRALGFALAATAALVAVTVAVLLALDWVTDTFGLLGIFGLLGLIAFVGLFLGALVDE